MSSEPDAEATRVRFLPSSVTVVPAPSRIDSPACGGIETRVDFAAN
jgi:hypothetical protein